MRGKFNKWKQLRPLRRRLDKPRPKPVLPRQFIRPMLTIGDACGLHDAIHLLRPKTIVALRSEVVARGRWRARTGQAAGRRHNPA
jgi:hypothetical protein